ncbi:MAG: YncE family protein [candidate division WOR-3 bacterium]
MKRFISASVVCLALACHHESEGISAYSIYILEDMAEAIAVYLPLSDSLVGPVPAGATPNLLFSGGGRLYLINSGFSGSPSVMVYEPTVPPSLVSSIPMPPGSNPYAGTFLDGRLYVSGFASDMLYILDGNAIVDSIRVGKAPEGVLAFGGRIYVVCSGYDLATYSFGPGSLYRYDPGSGQMDSVPLGTNPQFCATDNLGRLHVLVTGDYPDYGGSSWGSVVVVDPWNLAAVDSVILTGHSPGAIAILGDWGYAVGWDGVLLTYGIPSMTLMDSLVLGQGIMGLAAEPNGLWLTRWSNTEENWLYLVQGLSVSDSVPLGMGVGAKAVLPWVESAVSCFVPAGPGFRRF